MAEELKNIELYRLLYQKRLLIIGSTLVLSLAAIVLTLPSVITPLYKSEAVISPAGTTSAKSYIERDLKFGADKEIDEQIQILQSAIVRDSMVHKFDLIKRYNIDTGKPAGLYELFRQYDASVSIGRTRYNAISIKVFDTEATQAAAMANALITIADNVKNSIIKKNVQAVFQSIEKRKFEKAAELDKKASEIGSLLPGFIISGSMVGSKGTVEQLKEQMDIKSAIRQLQLSGKNESQLLSLTEYDRLLSEFLDLRESYEKAFLNSVSDVPPCFIISPAEAINKKAWPPRTLMVFSVAVATFLFSCTAVILSQRMKKLFNALKV